MARMRHPFFFAALLAAAAFLAGCAGGSRQVVRSSFVEFTPEQLKEVEAQENYQYRLQTDDVVKVAFADQEKLSPNPVRILPDGSVSLVGIDRVKLAGLTVDEADSLITAAYSQQFRDPRITVIVLESSGRQVYVLGEVKDPGIVKLQRGGLDPIAAVTLAGGFTPDAAKDSAVLVRVSPTGYLVQELDLDSFQGVAGAPLAGVQLQPFDVIYVPRSHVADFAYFAKSVLSGVLQITRIASDVRYISGNAGRY